MIRLLIGAVCISFSPVFVKTAGVSALASAFWRMAFGGTGLLVWLVLRGGFRRPSPRLIATGFLCAALFCADIVCWHEAVLRLGPGLGTLLANLQALLVPLLALALLREPVRPVFLPALALALAGLWLVVGPRWQGGGVGVREGVLLGLAAAFFYSLYLLRLRRAAGRGEDDSFRLVTMISLACALILGLAMLATGDSFVLPDAAAWASLAGYGLLAQVAGWVLITRGMPATPAALVGLLLLAQPTCSYLWDVLFFGARLGLAQVAGVALALAGIYLGSRSGRARGDDKPFMKT